MKRSGVAALAVAEDFHHLGLDPETLLGGLIADGPLDGPAVQFVDPAAGAADQELPVVVTLRLDAADEHVARGQPMNQPLFEQKVQRPVDRRRCAATPVGAQHVENRVGTQRLVVVEDDFQHSATQGSQSAAARFAQVFGRLQRTASVGMFGLSMWMRHCHQL